MPYLHKRDKILSFLPLFWPYWSHFFIVFLYSLLTFTNFVRLSDFIVFLRKDIVCFYIISHTSYTCITTVYRIYGAHSSPIVILVAVRIEQIVSTCIGNAVFRVNHARTKVSIVWIRIDTARSKPLTTMPYFSFILFIQPNVYFKMSSIFSPNLTYFLLLIICFS